MHVPVMSRKIPSPLLLAMGLGCLASAPIHPAAASEALLGLQSAMQACIETSQVQSCRLADAQVQGLTRNPAYAKASDRCKVEIGELAELVALLPKQDVVPSELVASLADVQQVCLPYGF